MKSIENILVVIDPTIERDFVVDRAKLIANASKASVRFFVNNVNSLAEHSYTYDGINGQFFEAQCKMLADNIKSILQGLVDEFNGEKIDASYVYATEHNLAEAIIKQAAKLESGLVLKSTHHHSLFQRSIISNTDWRLIRKCQSPLLLVKPNDWREGGSIVAAVDPLHSKAAQSELDHDLIQGAEIVAEQLGQTACVFHSYFPFVSSMFPMGGELAEHLKRIRQQHADKINDLLSDHTIAEDKIRLSHGELVPTLINYLKSVNANVLVIGSLSRNVVERAVIGNTAEKILEDCPCDVLVLKKRYQR